MVAALCRWGPADPAHDHYRMHPSFRVRRRYCNCSQTPRNLGCNRGVRVRTAFPIDRFANYTTDTLRYWLPLHKPYGHSRTAVLLNQTRRMCGEVHVFRWCLQVFFMLCFRSNGFASFIGDMVLAYWLGSSPFAPNIFDNQFMFHHLT